MLTTSLTADAAADRVELEFTVTNESDDAVTLSFRDAQRAEFVATTDDEERWRWSDDRMFGMAVGSETLDPGDPLTCTATWPTPSPGEYAIRAWLTSEDADATAETTVDVR